MPAQGWVCAGKLADLSEDEGVRVQLPGGGKKDAVALFKHGGQVYALEDRCCHAEKSLHGGDIEDIGTCVVGKHGEEGASGLCVQCPRHQRKFAGGLYFNLETGRACTPEYTSKFRKLDKHHIRVHDVLVEAGIVYVSAKGRSAAKKSRQHGLRRGDGSDDERPQPAGGRAASPGRDRAAPLEDERVRTDSARQSWHCRLQDVQRVNHDTFIFSLGHPVGEDLPPAPASPIWHVTVQAAIGGRTVDRDYTPISTWADWRDARLLRLLIKIYPDGLMTQRLARLQVGSSVQVSSPQATLLLPSLLPPGFASYPREPAKHAVLVAAGTGVVPMMQILGVALRGGQCLRTVTLLYSSKSPRDLLCWEELRAFEERRATDGRSPELRVWLAFSGGGAMPELRSRALAGMVCQRFDKAVVGRALAHLPPCELVHVVSSGPDGFFEAMQDSVQASRIASQAATFVNLDE